MRNVLFTLGYQQRTITEFVALAREACVDVIIDVRETAWSHKPGFSKAALLASSDPTPASTPCVSGPQDTARALRYRPISKYPRAGSVRLRHTVNHSHHSRA